MSKTSRRSTRNLKLQFQKNDGEKEIEVEDKDNNSNFYEGTTDIKISSFDASATNRIPSNGASSHHTNIRCEDQHGENSIIRKIKSESDA